MPNRILREGILTSERVERLNWAEEVFYRRLMSVVDDFGRYYARPALLLAACYPLLLKKVSDSDIEKWLSACENAALVRVYPAEDGKRYLQLLDFKQQVRAAASKFPPMPSGCVADAQQPPASAHLGVSVSGVVSEDVCGTVADAPPPPAAKKKKATQLPAEFCVSDRVTAWAAEHGFGQLDEHLEAFKLKAAAKAYTYTDWDAAFMGAIRDDWAKTRNRPTSFAQQAADVRTTTVPAKPGRDPALLRLEEDAAKAKPMTAEIRQALAQAAGRMTQ